MKPYLLLSILLTIFQLTAQEIVVKDINIISMVSHSVNKKQSVLIKQNKIIQIGDFDQLPVNDSTIIIEGANKYLMPALSDMHVHLPEKDKLSHFYKMNLAAGVTHVRVMNSASSQIELKQQIESKKSPNTPTLHFSRLIRRDLQKYSEQQFDSLIIELKENGLEFIKLFSLSDEISYDNLMKSAKKHNISVCGHYPKYAQFGQWKYIDIEKVLNSSYKSIEHLGGYDQLKSKDEIKKAIQLTKKNNTYNCPTIDWAIMAYDMQYPLDYKQRLTYKTLPKNMIDQWEIKYKNDIEKAGGDSVIINSKEKYAPKFNQNKNILKLLAKEDCLLLIGGDAGNTFQAEGFNVHEEMKNWSNIGIDNFTILKSATITPAMFFNEENERGTIEVGKNADLIILEQNPLENIENISTIITTIMRGNIFQKATLLPTN